MDVQNMLRNLEMLEDIKDLHNLGLSEVEIEGYLEFFTEEYFPELKEYL